jgi:hypothetical protein
MHPVPEKVTKVDLVTKTGMMKWQREVLSDGAKKPPACSYGGSGEMTHMASSLIRVDGQERYACLRHRMLLEELSIPRDTSPPAEIVEQERQPLPGKLRRPSPFPGSPFMPPAPTTTATATTEEPAVPTPTPTPTPTEEPATTTATTEVKQLHAQSYELLRLAATFCDGLNSAEAFDKLTGLGVMKLGKGDWSGRISTLRAKGLLEATWVGEGMPIRLTPLGRATLEAGAATAVTRKPPERVTAIAPPPPEAVGGFVQVDTDADTDGDGDGDGDADTDGDTDGEVMGTSMPLIGAQFYLLQWCSRYEGLSVVTALEEATKADDPPPMSPVHLRTYVSRLRKRGYLVTPTGRMPGSAEAIAMELTDKGRTELAKPLGGTHVRRQRTATTPSTPTPTPTRTPMETLARARAKLDIAMDLIRPFMKLDDERKKLRARLAEIDAEIEKKFPAAELERVFGHLFDGEAP